MKTSLIIATLAIVGADVVLADSPHFVGTPTASVNSTNGNLDVSFKEAGLGNTPITYDLSATETFTYQCFNKGSNQPQGAPNSGGPSNVATQTTITPTNGNITDTISLMPTAEGVSCQGGGLKLCLTHVSYSNVVLADITSQPNVTASLPGPFSADIPPPSKTNEGVCFP